MADLHSTAFGRVPSDSESYSIDGQRPGTVLYPEDIRELSVMLSYLSGQRLATAPWGGGTRMAVGNPISRLDAVLDLTGMDGVVAHNPGDLTLTVESGISLARLQRELAAHGQFLAIDAPVAERATIGGTLASGASGPLRWQYGNARDLVIGMKVAMANGPIVKSGGEVVKNVSGYDMARLHLGALGTLGVIGEVSFKLTPLPREERTLVAAFSNLEDAIGAGVDIFHSQATPLALTAFDGSVNRRSGALDAGAASFLAVRLGGRPRSLERQLRDCADLCDDATATDLDTLDEDAAARLWRKLADFGWDDDTTPLAAARTSLLPTFLDPVLAELTAPALGGSATPSVVAQPGYGGLSLFWFEDHPGQLEAGIAGEVYRARAAIHGAGGRLVIERCPPSVKAALDVWDDIGESIHVMRRMKEQYDPDSILNPGRYAGGI